MLREPLARRGDGRQGGKPERGCRVLVLELVMLVVLVLVLLLLL